MKRGFGVRFGRILCAAVLYVPLAGCNDDGLLPFHWWSSDAQDDVAMAEDQNSSCPVIDSRDWAAWVNAMPGPDAVRTLIVTGEVDMPTPGYSIDITLGPADRMMPPGQYLDLSVTPPDGMVAQVVTPMPVRFETPAVYPEYRKIVVRCGGTLLAEITDVPVAH